MIIHTRSATPLEVVMIEPSSGGKAHVWLRRDIVQTTETDTTSGDEVDVWEADEIHILMDHTPTVAEVEADFAALWLAHEPDGLSTEQALAARIEQLEAAAVELADLLAGGV